MGETYISAPNSTVGKVDLHARGNGLGSDQPFELVQRCPLLEAEMSRNGAKPQELKPLEYCDIQQLKLDLQFDDDGTSRNAEAKITKPRTGEPVNTALVYEPYQAVLKNFDIVLEVLADVEQSTTTYPTPFTQKDRLVDMGTHATGHPVSVKVTATNSDRHTSITPAHPHTALQLQTGNVLTLPGDVAESYGGATVQGKIYARRSTSMAPWADIWPFSTSINDRHYAVGTSCGNVRPPFKPNTAFLAQLVVMPAEEWKITLGLGALKEGGKSKTTNYRDSTDESGRTVRKTVIIVEKSGEVEKTTTIKNMSTLSGKGDSRQETKIEESTKIDSGFVSDSSLQETVKKSWQGKRPPKSSTSTVKSVNKIKITKKVGGKEVETDVQKVVNDILKIEHFVKEIGGLLQSVSIGASASYDYEILSGHVELGWGLRWPKAYVESNRVWYVERYISVGGGVDFINGALAAFFGLKISSTLLKFQVELGAFVQVDFKISLDAKGSISYTNPAEKARTIDGGVKLSFNPEFKASGGIKGIGKAFGYSVDGRMVFEGGISAKLESDINFQEPFFIKGPLCLGLEKKKTGAENVADGADQPTELDGLRFVGELVLVGDTEKTYQIDPWIICEGTEIYPKDHYWVGEKPK